MRLAASAREDSTTEGYARHWREFEGWCDEEGLDPLPATPQMIFAYVGALAEKGTIAASSLQPYLSAINSYHADCGFDKPALGHLVTAARRGMARGQARCDTRDTRVPMPAAAAARILRATLAALPSLAARKGSRGAADFLRRRYAFVLSFVFMGRQDTSTGLRSADHGIDEGNSGFIWLRISEKMRGGRRHMVGWVSETLDEEGVRAPAGFVYLGHSLRSGGSSAAEAIRVPRFRGNWLGGWSQNGRTRELHYMDPSVLPSPEAYELLGSEPGEPTS
ncbi:Integrase [Emiliania huxleyi CCMP1516]|uniref:Core-binding (CB) domain-containing protein n=2 Tax=Emiliania huxleyi TaxID=2903 RepID=A0A0D3IWG0_EMIH1|nr:Integrase [Emiliania huxleyi CCMP1516]EOD15595.1 Integrase [Emiliania huxleyi CCMP1516]|eukprot:XP_005768024.1 Integrase [Emiliania huxleyi CCMP1516]